MSICIGKLDDDAITCLCVHENSTALRVRVVEESRRIAVVRVAAEHRSSTLGRQLTKSWKAHRPAVDAGVNGR